MMEVKQLASQTLIGLKVRTCNANEMNAGTANIAELWQKFGEKFANSLTQNTKVYGVYTNYESDLTGDFVQGLLLTQSELKLDGIM